MNPDVKTFTSFWIPVRLLKKLENKKGKLSRNQLAVSLIEAGLTDDKIMKSVAKRGSKATNHSSQANATEVLVNHNNDTTKEVVEAVSR